MLLFFETNSYKYTGRGSRAVNGNNTLLAELAGFIHWERELFTVKLGCFFHGNGLKYEYGLNSC